MLDCKQAPELEGCALLTVQDIVDLPVFDSIWLAAPCDDYASRPVGKPSHLDHEPFSGEYDAFKPNDFVFTSLALAGIDPTLVDDALIELMNRDVAAIAISAHRNTFPSSSIPVAISKTSWRRS